MKSQQTLEKLLINKSAVNLKSVVLIKDTNNSEHLLEAANVLKLDKILSNVSPLYRYGEINWATSEEAKTQNKIFDLPPQPLAYNLTQLDESSIDYNTFSAARFDLRLNQKTNYEIFESDFKAKCVSTVFWENLKNTMIDIIYLESLRYYNEIRLFFRSVANYKDGSNVDINSTTSHKFAGDDTAKKTLRERVKKQIIHIDKSAIENCSADEIPIKKPLKIIETYVREILKKNIFFTSINKSLIRVFVAPWLWTAIRYSSMIDQIGSQKSVQSHHFKDFVVSEDRLLGQKVDQNSVHKQESYDLSNIAGLIIITKSVPHAIGTTIFSEINDSLPTLRYQTTWESGVTFDYNRIDRVIVLTTLKSDNFDL